MSTSAINAEAGVLAIAMRSNGTTTGQIVEALGAGPEMFQDGTYAQIYQAIVALWKRNEPADLIAVESEWSKKHSPFNRQERMVMLGQMEDATFRGLSPTGALYSFPMLFDCNLSWYIGKVRDAWTMRQAMLHCQQAAQDAERWDGTADDYLDRIEGAVAGLRRKGGTSGGFHAALVGAMGEVEAMNASEGPTGLSTGFMDLDRLTGGLHPQEVTVVCAFPSQGKTALAVNIAQAVMRAGHAVGMFSMEMSATSIALRVLAAESRVNFREKMQGESFRKVVDAFTYVKGWPFVLDDEAAQSVERIRAKARRMVSESKVKLLVIDYLQLATSESGRVGSRADEVEAVSRGVKAMAMELRVPVVALSQLTEGGSDGQVKTRQSRSINQDADNLHVLDADGKETEDYAPMALWIKKQRNGPRNVPVKLTFLKKYTRFESAARGED